MTENNIILYPSIETVFKDTTLGLYFRPLLTANILIEDKPYSIHLVATDGLFCCEKFKYSEQNFFGFKYDKGLYEFLGDLKVFNDYNKVPALHNFLQLDFLQNRDIYLANKTKSNDYLKRLNVQLKKVSRFQDFSNAEYYAEAFYSYEFTKYYFEKFGKHSHISVVTENYGKNTDPFLFDKGNAISILEEFFINLKYNVTFDYSINDKMFVAGTERYRFMSINGGGDVLAMLDQTKDIVYILEYSSWPILQATAYLWNGGFSAKSKLCASNKVKC